MTFTRISITIDEVGKYLGFTQFLTDQIFQSNWHNPNVPLLIFADSGLGGAPVNFHGGAIGTGLPIQANFWGSWWLTPEGVDRRVMIEQRLQAVIASPYFSELAQYGIAPPRWRGSLVVTRPGAPGAFNSIGDQQAVPDLIDSLIDDNVFPDPDDERIAHVVFMPKGFTQSIGANGAHTYDYNYTFPIDKDYYWVAWVRWFDDIPGETREDVTRTTTHELVELFTDPENDGWYADPQSAGEVGDLAVSSGTKQSAFVNGAMVSAYWSNRHGATVIPIDRDYKARVKGVGTASNSRTDRGTFRPDPSDSRLCDIVPACCLKDRDYTYTLARFDSVIKLRAETQRYRAPVFTWMIEGVAISGSGSHTVNVFAQTFTGRKSTYQQIDVTVQFTVANDQLTITTTGVDANFDFTVSCSVRDGSITGKVKIDVISVPSLDVGVVGIELTVDPEYARSRAECVKAVAKLFSRKDEEVREFPRNPGGPVEVNPGILNSIPAYSRLEEFNRARKVTTVAQIARSVLPPAAARDLIQSLVADTPALQAAQATILNAAPKIVDRE